MPTASTTFLIDTAGEYAAWTIDTVADVTVSHNTTTTDADGSGGNGQVQMSLSTKNRNRTGHIRIQKTWEDLGVPAGGTVTHVQVVYYYRVLSIVGASVNGDTGPFELRSSDNSTLTQELLALLNVTAAGSYTSRDSGTIALPASEASNTSHWFRLTHRLQTPNTSGTSIDLLHDYIVITATYTAPATTSGPKILVGGSWTKKQNKLRVGGSFVSKNLYHKVGGIWVLK